MCVTVKDFVQKFEQKVPLHLSMPSDKNGLKIGAMSKKINTILCTLELTKKIIDQAIIDEVDLIVVHHDPLYISPKYLLYDDPHTQLSIQLITHDIALYVAHTNLDIVTGGLNDYIFTILGGGKPKNLENDYGIGRYGLLKQAYTLQTYLDTYIEPLKMSYRLSSDSFDRTVEKIAVVNGAGASYLKLAIQKKVDLFITGDVDYHTVMTAREFDLPILDIGHNIEHVVTNLLKSIVETIMAENNYKIAVLTTNDDFDPWVVKKI